MKFSKMFLLVIVLLIVGGLAVYKISQSSVIPINQSSTIPNNANNDFSNIDSCGDVKEFFTVSPV